MGSKMKRIWNITKLSKVAIEIERKSQNSRKPLGIQEARELVFQMQTEEISFSRFVELINEGGTK